MMVPFCVPIIVYSSQGRDFQGARTRASKVHAPSASKLHAQRWGPAQGRVFLYPEASTVNP